MLRLLLLRHAKAIPYAGRDDYERTLTDRGRADAALPPAPYKLSINIELMFPRSDTGLDNKIEANKDYVVPASQGWFKVSGPPGQDVVYWMVSPLDLGHQYMPLPPPPKPGNLQLKPRCDDTIFKARGDCIDTSAGVKPVKPGETLPENLGSVATATPRELLFIQENGKAKESVVVSSPVPLSGPVVYELRLSHR